MANGDQVREITLEQMMTLRASTEAAGTWLRSEFSDRLETIRPLLLPRRFLGEHIKSAVQETVRDQDKTFEQLQNAFREISGEPIRVSSRLDSPIESIPGDLQIHDWEYTHEAGNDRRKLTLKSPVSWVLTYAGAASWGQIREMLLGTAPRNETQIKQFAVGGVILKMALDRSAGIIRLLQALRLSVEILTRPESGKVPIVRLTAPIPAFRPTDALLLQATKLAGVSVFEELVDVDALATLEDPFRTKLLSLAGSA